MDIADWLRSLVGAIRRLGLLTDLDRFAKCQVMPLAPPYAA
jgi:hypothetical protein